MVASLHAAHGASGPHSRAGELMLPHPEVGPIEVDCQALFTEDQSQALLVLTPAPGSEAEDKIRLLAVLGHEKFAATADE